MMAKQNKTSKIKRNNKTKTNKLKGGSSSGLLLKTAKSMKPKSYSLNSGAKPSSEVLEKSIDLAIENVQRQNLPSDKENSALEKITEQLKSSLRQEQRSNGNNYETKNAELNATKSENNKPKNTQNSDPTNFKMTLPPNHSWGKTLGFGLGVGIITGSVILATSH